MNNFDPSAQWFLRQVAEEAEKRRLELYRPMKLLLPVVIFLILLASVASSEEKKESPSEIGRTYDLFYAACECRESV